MKLTYVQQYGICTQQFGEESNRYGFQPDQPRLQESFETQSSTTTTQVDLSMLSSPTESINSQDSDILGLY